MLTFCIVFIFCLVLATYGTSLDLHITVLWHRNTSPISNPNPKSDPNTNSNPNYFIKPYYPETITQHSYVQI